MAGLEATFLLMQASIFPCCKRREIDTRRFNGRRLPAIVLSRSFLFLIVVWLWGCGEGAPDFTLEPDPIVAVEPGAAGTISIGSLATPPPGEYRFALIHMNGIVDVRELFTVNGPGPWRAYIGRVLVSPSVARSALADMDEARHATPPRDGQRPCILAVDLPTQRRWQGCNFPDVAERTLSKIPRVTDLPVSSECSARFCQVRLVWELAGGRHQVDGRAQEIVLDRGGAFWCARAEPPETRQTITLEVARGTISARDATRVFGWLTRAVSMREANGWQGPPRPAVMVRSAADWRRITFPEAQAVRARWRQLSERLPTPCGIANHAAPLAR